MYMYMYMYVCMYVRTYVRTYVRMHVYMYDFDVLSIFTTFTGVWGPGNSSIGSASQFPPWGRIYFSKWSQEVAISVAFYIILTKWQVCQPPFLVFAFLPMYGL